MTVRIVVGSALDALRTLPNESVQCVVTSPPYYGLRDYGVDGQIGLERTPAEFITTLLAVFTEVKRVLRADGLCFVNIGDSYAASGGHTKQGATSQRQGRSNISAQHFGTTRAPSGTPVKNLLLVPQRFAIAMQDDGWIVRQEIVWSKRSCMPESVRDRFTQSWEPVFMFSKSARYFFDQEAVRQPPANYARRGGTAGVTGSLGPQSAAPGASLHQMAANSANMRDVWSLSSEPSRLEHYAGFPTEIPRRCILAGSRIGDTVLDPFLGSGTTALVANRLERDAIGIELNPEYAKMAYRRIEQDCQEDT